MNVLWILSLLFNAMAVGASIALRDFGGLSVFNIAFVPLSAYMIARSNK